MIRRVKTRIGWRVVAGIAVALVLAAAPAASGAFTGTSAALKVVREMRAAYDKVRAVRDVLSGDLVYCPSVAEGWTYAPQPGCRVRARVSEEDDLFNGRVVRAVGEVRAPSRPTLRYVVSAHGWFQAAAGVACWKSFGLPFRAALWVSYPFPGEHLTVKRETKSEIVLEAITSSSGYQQLDYINPRTHLELRELQVAHTSRRVYRVDISVSLLADPRSSIATPACRS